MDPDQSLMEDLMDQDQEKDQDLMEDHMDQDQVIDQDLMEDHMDKDQEKNQDLEVNLKEEIHLMKEHSQEDQAHQGLTIGHYQ